MKLSARIGLVSAVVVGALAQDSPVPNTPIPGNYSGVYRPQIHFSPPTQFMNDPNGLFLDANGTYHLYYQYDPTAVVGGNQHWGHATSQDLYHWLNQAIAIYPPTNDSQVFTGSAVIDVNNTSGFFPNQDNGVVAIYTLNTPTAQVQEIAYSQDGGFTFTRYAGNPVINVASNSFRDPKVIWYEDHWAMVVAYSSLQTVGIYTSSDLKTWTHASNFTHPGLSGDYECPNLVKMPVDRSEDSMYLLLISTSGGSPSGGSITQYFPGTFNGTHFTPVDDAVRDIDFGKDNYAGQFFYGIPDEEPALFIAWASNAAYSQNLPTAQEGWRSTMSLPRRNFLANVPGVGLDLISIPQDLRPVIGEQLVERMDLANNSVAVDYSAVESNAVYFQVFVSGAAGASSDATLNVTFSSPVSGEALSGAYAFGDAFVLDRGGVRGFNDSSFTGTFSTPSPLNANGTWALWGLIDRSIIEVFVDHGIASATATFFATQPLTVLSISTSGLPANASVIAAVYAVESAWKGMENAEGIVVGNFTATDGGTRDRPPVSCRRAPSSESILGIL